MIISHSLSHWQDINTRRSCQFQNDNDLPLTSTYFRFTCASLELRTTHATAVSNNASPDGMRCVPVCKFSPLHHVFQADDKRLSGAVVANVKSLLPVAPVPTAKIATWIAPLPPAQILTGIGPTNHPPRPVQMNSSWRDVKASVATCRPSLCASSWSSCIFATSMIHFTQCSTPQA